MKRKTLDEHAEEHGMIAVLPERRLTDEHLNYIADLEKQEKDLRIFINEKNEGFDDLTRCYKELLQEKTALEEDCRTAAEGSQTAVEGCREAAAGILTEYELRGDGKNVPTGAQIVASIVQKLKRLGLKRLVMDNTTEVKTEEVKPMTAIPILPKDKSRIEIAKPSPIKHKTIAKKSTTAESVDKLSKLNLKKPK